MPKWYQKVRPFVSMRKGCFWAPARPQQWFWWSAGCLLVSTNQNSATVFFQSCFYQLFMFFCDFWDAFRKAKLQNNKQLSELGLRCRPPKTPLDQRPGKFILYIEQARLSTAACLLLRFVKQLLAFLAALTLELVPDRGAWPGFPEHARFSKLLLVRLGTRTNKI